MDSKKNKEIMKKFEESLDTLDNIKSMEDI